MSEGEGKVDEGRDPEVVAYAVKLAPTILALKPYVVVHAGRVSIHAKRNYSTSDQVSPRPC